MIVILRFRGHRTRSGGELILARKRRIEKEVPIETKEETPTVAKQSYFFPNIGNGVVVEASSLKEARELAKKKL